MRVTERLALAVRMAWPSARVAAPTRSQRVRAYRTFTPGGSDLAYRECMAAVVSALLAVALFLAAWAALSVLAVPVLAVCVRSRARGNARITRRLGRDGWTSASRS